MLELLLVKLKIKLTDKLRSSFRDDLKLCIDEMVLTYPCLETILVGPESGMGILLLNSP